MIIGVPKEIKTDEFRVGLTPTGTRELARDGHRVIIETGAGEGSGFSNDEERKAGAEIRSSLNTYRGEITNEVLKKVMGFDT